MLFIQKCAKVVAKYDIIGKNAASLKGKVGKVLKTSEKRSLVKFNGIGTISLPNSVLKNTYRLVR